MFVAVITIFLTFAYRRKPDLLVDGDGCTGIILWEHNPVRFNDLCLSGEL